MTSNILVYHYLIFLFVLFLPTLMSHRATHFFLSTLFENSNCYSLTFKLVLQNHFHGLASTIVRLLSDECVCLNFVLRLTAIFLTTSAIYKRPLSPPPPPPPPPPPFFLYISVFSHCVLMSATRKNNN